MGTCLKDSYPHRLAETVCNLFNVQTTLRELESHEHEQLGVCSCRLNVCVLGRASVDPVPVSISTQSRFAVQI